MKLFLAIFVLVQFCEAIKSFDSFDVMMKIKSQSHWEPEYDKSKAFDRVETKWIEQKLDNFDPQNERTWQMRYMENINNLQDGGPIFIFVGGEWTISEGNLLFGHMVDMARALNGTMFYTEHRYYGISEPMEDLSVENLKFLSADQALADLAHFIVHVKSTTPALKNSGVILVGMSYSASMVTWFMQKYPHLANGAWASSAPLEAKVAFSEYKEVVSEAMEFHGGQKCTQKIQAGFEEWEKLVTERNSEKIEKSFHLCHPYDVDNKFDVWLLFDVVAETFSFLVQNGFVSDIEQSCGILSNSTIENDFENLASWFMFRGNVPEEPIGYCFEHRYEKFVSRMNSTDLYNPRAMWPHRQWTYQTCTEFGWFQSSESENIIFGSSFPSEMSLQLCRDLYSDL